MNHGAITLGSTIMVVGGWPEGGTHYKTELWDMDSLTHQVIDSTPRKNLFGLGLFPVHYGYCNPRLGK